MTYYVGKRKVRKRKLSNWSDKHKGLKHTCSSPLWLLVLNIVFLVFFVSLCFRVNAPAKILTVKPVLFGELT